MAVPRRRKLKVFRARMGFYDTVVAAPSRAAALRAWDVRQDLFAEGQAAETDDPKARADAEAQPETVLKRPVGSTGPFLVDPTDLPRVPAAPRRRASPARPAPPKPSRPPPDRAELTAAETALRRLDQQRLREEGRLADRQAKLDAETREAQAAYVAARKAAEATVDRARAAYRRAGGTD